jgi:hypothetical protein
MNVGSRATVASRRGRDTVQLGASSRLERIHRVLLSRSRRAGEARPPTIATRAAITLRLASRDDEAAIERLAQLCERARPPGPSLVAEVDGQIHAALPHVSRELLSDPYLPMAELRSLLRLRAAQLDASDPAWVCEDTAQIVPLPNPRKHEQIAPRLRPRGRRQGVSNRSRRTRSSAGSTP